MSVWLVIDLLQRLWLRVAWQRRERCRRRDQTQAEYFTEVVVAIRLACVSLNEDLEENVLSLIVHNRGCSSNAIWILMKMAH